MLKGPHTPPLSKWTLGFIITMLLYFHNYRHVADHLMIHLTLPNGCTQRSAKWVEVNKCTTRVCSSPILPVWRVSFAKPSHPWLLGHPWVTHYTLPRGTSLLCFELGRGGERGMLQRWLISAELQKRSMSSLQTDKGENRVHNSMYHITGNGSGFHINDIISNNLR